MRLSVLLALWAAAFILPSGSIAFFDGIPFSSIPEAIALVAILPLVLSATLRRMLARWLDRTSRRTRLALLGAALVALTLKVSLIAAPPFGFPACYQSTLTPPPAGTCERSFENPFFRWRATRVDSSIDFGPTDWNLSFFNSSRFNFYPWVAGRPRRDRLPFTVTWRGAVDSAGDPALVTYVGEGIVAIDQRVLALERAYGRERAVRVDVPPGRHHLRIVYTFDDGSRTRENRRFGSYATFRLQHVGSDGVARAVDAARPPLALLAAALMDALAMSAAVALLFWYGSLLRREVRAGAVVMVIFGAAMLVASGTGLPAAPVATLVTWSLLGLILARNRSSRLLLAYFVVLGLGAWLSIGAYPSLGSVRYRSAGNDWLTYESLARTILETRSLAGGEPVFYIQPLFRYVRFAEHLLLGDGDLLIDLLAWSALVLSILWAASALPGTKALSRARLILFAVGGALTLALATMPRIIEFVRLSLSEHVTWIFLAGAFALLSGRRAMRWVLGAAALGAALITRPNQAPALLMAALAFLSGGIRQRPRPTALAAGVFVIVCLLPLAHNLYYGGRAVLFTTTARHPATLGVPITTLARVPTDAAARGELWTQLRGLLFIRPLPSEPRIPLALLHALQAAWLGAIWVAWRGPAPGRVRILVLVPALYLGVHVVYDITSYYPRHLLAGYFAMGLVTMVAAASAAASRARSASTIISTSALKSTEGRQPS